MKRFHLKPSAAKLVGAGVANVLHESIVRGIETTQTLHFEFSSLYRPGPILKQAQAMQAMLCSNDEAYFRVTFDPPAGSHWKELRFRGRVEEVSLGFEDGVGGSWTATITPTGPFRIFP